ncbi:MAG: type II toxin-antitoxin system RelE/ParE family toxin [Pelomonas sp.]|nr:type II toxin-antitoxin system RelE/ParE family toxin [Roseateles sp.]
MSFRVDWSAQALEDLLRLYDYLLARELQAAGGDLGLPARAIETLESAAQSLARAPFIYRKIQDSPFARELVVPFGDTGYVLSFEIMDQHRVVIAAIRHQREDDYH